MPGIRHREQSANIEFIEDFLADQIDAVAEKFETTSKTKRSTGEYLRKIEELLERKKLHNDLADYEWDD